MNVKQRLERRMARRRYADGYSETINHFYPGLAQRFKKEIVQRFSTTFSNRAPQAELSLGSLQNLAREMRERRDTEGGVPLTLRPTQWYVAPPRRETI